MMNNLDDVLCDEKLTENANYPYHEAFLDNAAAFSKAAELGLEVVIPAANVLTVDIDSPNVSPTFYKVLRNIENYFTVTKVIWTRSNSGNLHAYVTLSEPLNDLEKIILQSILGSDPLRELFSLARLKKGLELPILMFEKEDQLAKIEQP